MKEEGRNNLAAVDARTGALTAWDPNATGAVSSLTASGALVYAGGTFSNLGATPRTFLGALDLTPGSRFGSALPFAPKIENLGQGAKAGEPAVVQSIEVAPDGSRMYIGGNFDHVNGVVRKNLAALLLPGGEVDPEFDPGEPQGTVRVVHYEPGLNPSTRRRLDSIQIRRASPAPSPQRRQLRNAQHRTPSSPPEPLLLEAVKIVPTTPAPGRRPRLPGPHLRRAVSSATAQDVARRCRRPAYGGCCRSIGHRTRRRFSPRSFSEMDNNDHKNTIMSTTPRPQPGDLTPGTAGAHGIPLRRNVDPIRMLFAAAAGRAARPRDPQIGSATSPIPLRCGDLLDGDAVSSTFPTPSATGLHFDFVAAAPGAPHGAAFDFTGPCADWDPNSTQ